MRFVSVSRDDPLTARDGHASRVAVVDLGSNTTRLLIAEVRDGGVGELHRRTKITALGEGVDASGDLDDGLGADDTGDRDRQDD